MDTKLKPCPFCGSENISIAKPGGYWRARCENCRISISGYIRKDGLIESWNRRPDDAQNEIELKVDGKA